jgi:DNA helicase II / ATP-dependent DNA helicase PcrA
MKDNKGNEYLDLLNDPQKAAVVQTEGPVIIIAGAGSGKTRVLTYRIAHLIEKGVDPFNIIALTFTNKAAKEMRQRIEKVVGMEARNLWMGTFHSIFARILRSEAHHLGYPSNFTIYDTDDAKNLIKSIVKEMNLDDKLYKPNIILSRISSAKNNLITADMYGSSGDLTNYDSSSGRPYITDIYNRYTARCFKAGAMDFDDLLLKTHELFTKHINVLNVYQHKFKYVMVDEYQDTNHCQYMIVKKLAAVNRNICVVGDDAQSIYSFRGATIQNILNFQGDYPESQMYKLEQNYRSSQNIVDAAHSVIGKNKEQLKKKIWTANDEGEKINVIRALTDNEEGRIIAQSIFEERMRNNRQHSDFAILYRTNAQSRSLEEALRKINIPYRIYGGQSFYQRKEIKDIIAYLRLTINHRDEEALKRVINYPARGIGKTSMEKVVVMANENNLSLWEVIENAHEYEMLGRASEKLRDFSTMIKSYATDLEKKDAYDLASHIAKSTGLLKVLHDDKTVEGISRYENVVQLLSGIKEFVEEVNDDVLDKSLGFYLQDIALLTNADKEEDDNDKVALMTIHSSKGLEFPCVYISGLEENLFPSQLSLNSRKDLEEERRLFYVALTRAEKRLTLTYATSRFRFGNIVPCEASRFIDEIDIKYLQIIDTGPIRESRPRQRFQKREVKGKPKHSSTYGRQTGFARNSASAPPRKPINPPEIEGFVAEDTSKLEKGMKIQHQRFGNGKVLNIDGEAASRKATIEFDDYGTKQLILKFAKLRIC